MTKENGSTSDILQQTIVRVNPSDLCVAQFGDDPLIDSQFCAGVLKPEPKDTCQVRTVLFSFVKNFLKNESLFEVRVTVEVLLSN